MTSTLSGLIKIFINLFACIYCIHASVAQDSITSKKDSIRQTDLIEIIFKKHPEKQSVKIKKDKKVYITVLPAVGYTPATSLAAVLAANVVFFTGDPKTTYASVVATSATYTANKQFILPVRSNIWLKDNSWNLIGDWRFMKYPQYTYGLGGGTEKSDANMIDFSYVRFYQSALRNLYSKLYFGGGVNVDYFYNIKEEWNGSAPSDFETYGVGTGTESFSDGLNVQCIWDNRKNTINPEKGSYVNIVYRFYPNFMGNSKPWASVYADFRKYIQLPSKGKNILGFWLFYWGAPKGTAPYLLLPSNGWDTYTNTARGYVQGRFRSINMLYAEAEYRYRITKNGLLGGVLFVNAATYSEPGNGKYKYVYPAVGAGLRVKLNKDSNTNLLIDFAIGLKHSNGFYLDVGEIF
ncbi:BamA/TamA family outer membrane protein [Cytophaga aurantiaca]|uniref:BamA/TamA family outer membrane protein n=1 Tax=Cytophaga aurantiaca TaxID=29530 RepID=UPI00037B8066|nr:BamA/TamA family outer membrane protein [Cytophaga aurantiaca]